MNILDTIIIDKKREVELKKSIIPVSQLEASVLFNSRTYSMSKLLKNSFSGIIAEHKRRSPSKAIINNNHSVEAIDCYQPRMPTIMPDRVQPTPGPDVYINCINTCN